MTLGPSTLRTAVATARVGGAVDPSVHNAARDAAALAIKQTPFWLAAAPPTPVFDLEVSFTPDGDSTVIELAIAAIATSDLTPFAFSGITAAAIATGAVTITDVSTIKTTGGARMFRTQTDGATAVVIVLSDTVASGAKPDTAGKSVADALRGAGFDVLAYEVMTDDSDALATRLREWLDQSPDVIITVGGTGVGPRDRSVETVRSLLTTEIPGLMEAARAYGQARTPYSALSRGIAGLADRTIVATFPGSRRGAEETIEALLTGLVHLVDVMRKTQPHEGGYA